MSANLLYTVSDDSPDLRKQIGCINGIFHLFDRHHLLGSRPRRLLGHNSKPLPPGHNGNPINQPANASERTLPDKNMKKAVREKHRISTESSKTSFSSSSCSSSFSSMDYNRTSQLESPAFSHTIFPETPAREFPIYHPNDSPQLSRKSLDLRDVVKDSIHREARGLLVKTAVKDEAGYQNLKYIDSPRPMQQPNSANTRLSNLKESCRYLPRLGDAAWSSNERKDGSLVAAKDTRRFSYDGRESRDGLKSTIKIKELPRLSLDSRERSLRCSTIDRKSNCLPGDLHRENRDANSILNQQQEPGSYRRPSSVVAKLMGLEIIPDSPTHNHIQTGQTESCPDVICDPFLKSSRPTDDNKRNWASSSPRQHSHKEPTLSQPRNADFVKKPSASSRFPIELAPWRQQEGSKGQTPASKNATKAQNSPLSVYGEIEKRLAQLEFKKSGKDLRALKQILEAMQKTKEVLESRKDRASNFVSQTRSSLVQSSSNQVSPTIKGTQAVKTFKSPIVIIKPAKCDGKAVDSASATIPTVSRSGLRRIQTGDSGDTRKEMTVKQMTKDLTPRSNHLRGPSTRNLNPLGKNTTAKAFRSIDTLKVTPPSTGDNTNSDKGSGNMNPRLQQKKIGPEKHTTPSSESSMTRRQPNRQKKELGSPRRKYRVRSPHLQQTDNQLTENSDLRDFSYQGETSSVQSESNISCASTADTEVTSADRSNGINVTLSEHGSQKQKHPESRFNEERPMVEPIRVSLEQPSPVSVLDATFYGDESPSPVKKTSNVFKDEEEFLSSEEEEWIPKDLKHFSSCIISILCPGNDNLLNSNLSHEELITAGNSCSYDSKNPDHKYILEILLASGLLGKVESSTITIQLRQLSVPINPNLFIVLEQSKEGTGMLKDKHNGKRRGQIKHVEKVRRKLVFDTVNEILAQQLLLESSSNQWLSSTMLAEKRPRGQQLLRSLCSEIDHLQANNSNCFMNDEDDSLKSILREDLMHQPLGFKDNQGESSGIVLDIERLIFKDLVSEVVCGEIVSSRGRPGGHRRQLFRR